MISDRAHVIFPWHFEEDRLLNEPPPAARRSAPRCAASVPVIATRSAARTPIRLGDMYRANFASGSSRSSQAKTQLSAALGGAGRRAAAGRRGDLRRSISGYAERLRPHVADTTAYLLDAVEAGKRILFEGAQGALLDVDHGTFPFVTSSNSSGVGVSSGSGVPGRYLTKVIGVMKAYCTRVGGGPFPTEQDNATGQHIRERGNEYGTVTRRPRRCGWFDAVAARYTARLSGVDCLAVMLLDVLSELPEMKICTAYEIDGRRVTDFPSHVDDLRRVEPVYETLPGWQEEISQVRRLADLPRRRGAISTGSAS